MVVSLQQKLKKASFNDNKPYSKLFKISFMSNQIPHLKEHIQNARVQLLAHPVYGQINDLSGLQKFTSVHVFAVWDFMSLLKSLQIGLTSVTLPWVPVGSANTRFLINEIVAGEESDIDENGNRISHFELYLNAMQQMGSSTIWIDQVIAKIKSGCTIEETIENTNLPIQVKQFLSFTFDIAQHAPMHVKAAVFTFGREDLIPDMFTEILHKIHGDNPGKVSIFKYYIERHIEVDGGHHSLLALEMVAALCGDDEKKWEEAKEASLKSLTLRSVLWDGILM
jgi:hypothetical protein